MIDPSERQTALSEATDQARHAAVLRWLAREAPPAITLLCAEADPASLPGTLVQATGCLADVPPAWVAELARHAQVSIHVAGCDADGRTRARLGFLADLTPAITLDAAASGPRRLVRYVEPPADRRALLGVRTIAAPAPEGTLRQRLVSALRDLPRSGDAPSPTPRLVADGCTVCGVCVRVCPAGALSLVQDGTMATLGQLVERCEGSALCVAACPAQALSLQGSWPWSAVLEGAVATLTQVRTVSCAKCGARLPAADEHRLCPVCRAKADRPFRSILPPAAAVLLARRRAQPVQTSPE